MIEIKPPMDHIAKPVIELNLQFYRIDEQPEDWDNSTNCLVIIKEEKRGFALVKGQSYHPTFTHIAKIALSEAKKIESLSEHS